MFDDFEGRLTAIRAEDAIALRRQNQLEALPECFVIVDDQDTAEHFTAPFWRGRGPLRGACGLSCLLIGRLDPGMN